MTGALDARAVPGAEAVLVGVRVDNAGWVLEPLADADGDLPSVATPSGSRPLSPTHQMPEGLLMVDWASRVLGC